MGDAIERYRLLYVDTALCFMQDYKELSVWRKAHALALNVDRLAGSIRPRGSAGIIDQLRRSSLSISSNIAEGCARPTRKDFAKFLQIAIASASELEYQLRYAADSGRIPHSDFESRRADVIEVRRMLFGLLKRVRATDPSPSR